MNHNNLSQDEGDPVDFVEMPATGKRHYILNRDGKYFLQNGQTAADSIYLTDASVNPLEVAKKLAIRHITRDPKNLQ